MTDKPKANDKPKTQAVRIDEQAREIEGLKDTLAEIAEAQAVADKREAARSGEITQMKDALGELLKGMSALQHPTGQSPTPAVSPREVAVGPEYDIKEAPMDPTGQAPRQAPSFVVDEAPSLDTEVGLQQMGLEAFMNQMVQVRVNPEIMSDDSVPYGPEVILNGERLYFPPYEVVKCRRYFVESLVRMTKISYRTHSAPSASRQNQYVAKATKVLRFPFDVIGDSGQGRDWLNTRMREEGLM